jgi:hypothetical protein
MLMISTNFPYDFAGKLKYFSGRYLGAEEEFWKGFSELS